MKGKKMNVEHRPAGYLMRRLDDRPGPGLGHHPTGLKHIRDPVGNSRNYFSEKGG